MKRIHLSHLVACLAVITQFTVSACSPVKDVADNKMNPAIEKNDTVKAFRFELFQSGESAVYAYSGRPEYNYGSYYKRDMGSNEGWNYTIDLEPMNALTKLAVDLKLSKYPYTELNDEDKSRDRWNIEVTFTNGKHVSIVNYITEANKDKDAKICDKATRVFKAIAITDKDGKMMGEFSKTTYSGGKPVKRIDYTSDGIVHGGRDYTIPNGAPQPEF